MTTIDELHAFINEIIHEKVSWEDVIKAAFAYYRLHTYIRELEETPIPINNKVAIQATKMTLDLLHRKMHELVPSKGEEE